ncbi:MAG: 5-oxoprolinase subunit PxpB [Rhodocyclaceae bacterium]|nr:5-oxoprolinase subunit PxpB [Rhodocyclaceae bacterium]
MQARLLDVADAAVTVEFGDAIDPALLARVAAFDQVLQEEIVCGRLPGVIETVPTFRSLTVLYDPLLTSRAELDPALMRLLAPAEVSAPVEGRLWRLPVCYGGEFGPDLDALAQACGLDRQAVIDLHAASTVRVYMLGFLPGFPFMGDLPQALAQPRRSEPRLRVPAGSVATAGRLTAIYPWESPGGWHLLGRCPVPLFSPHWPAGALLRPGDRVAFAPVAPDEYAALAERWRHSPEVPCDYLVAE